MKNLSVEKAELIATQFRAKYLEIGIYEPINIKSALRKLKVFTMYRALSETACGISVKAPNGEMFILVNSSLSRGRQHFTIAHELYHLFYDEDPKPHICCEGKDNGIEKDANLFASTLLLPKEGLLKIIPDEEIKENSLTLATILRLEQFFQVSRMTLLIRLKKLDFINQSQLNVFNCNVKKSAHEYGYDVALYNPGNDGLIVGGDYGEKARILFESGKISESHYYELMNSISNEKED